MCVNKIVCLAMCVEKIDCRQPADLYIKKTAKKIKRRPKLFLAPLGQQFHLIGILYILPHLKGIYPEFQVIRGFSQKILADLLSYDQIHS